MSRAVDPGDVAMLIDMGFEEAKARQALRSYTLDDAVSWLLCGANVSSSPIP
jgi:hypothetical protein